MGLREDKKLETRNAIVDVGLSLFRSHGFARTRVNDIAAKLRISEATFFNYFPTKHSVLEAAAEDLFDRSMDRLQAVLDSDEPVPQRLENLQGAFVADIAGDRELATLLGEHTNFFTGGRSDRLVQAQNLLTAIFTEGQSRGEIRSDVPAPLLTELLLSMTLGLIHSWVTDPDASSEPIDQQLDAATKIVLWGCAIDTARAEPASARKRPRAKAATKASA